MSLLKKAHDALLEAVYHENAVGGEARAIVMQIGRSVGVDLTDDPVDGEVWSVENMKRVARAVESMRLEVARLKGLPPQGFADHVDVHVPYAVRGF